MEPTLMVIGLNHRMAPLATRERFWISEKRRYDVLRQLRSAEGIEEIVVLSTCCRTEFLLWASEPTFAANSVLHFLGSDQGLKLTEWQHFYRLLDEAALAHIFRVASGLDSLILGEPRIVPRMQAALEQARAVGAAGRFLKSTLDMALQVAERVATETRIHEVTTSVPDAVFQFSRQIFGALDGHRVLLLGAGETLELAAGKMVAQGAGPVVVIDQSPTRALEVAQRLGGSSAPLADRWKCMLAADIIVSATGCPHFILTREEAERIAEERNHVAVVIVDLGMPRDVDPAVRRADGVLLCDLEGLARAVKNDARERVAVAAQAEAIISEAAQAGCSKLRSDFVVPTIVALRQRLEEICRQELDSFIAERGPFPKEQDQSLHAITAQVIQKIASSLVRELKELPEQKEQEEMTAAVARLFHLESPKRALAGTKLEREDERKPRAVAINY